MNTVSDVDGDYIENSLNSLIHDYHISAETLSRLFKIEVDAVNNFKNHKEELTKDFDKWVNWSTLMMMLSSTPTDDPDFRVRGFIEVLIEDHGISAKTIAKFADIKYI